MGGASVDRNQLGSIFRLICEGVNTSRKIKERGIRPQYLDYRLSKMRELGFIEYDKSAKVWRPTKEGRKVSFYEEYNR